MGKRVKVNSKHGKQASRKKVPSEQTGGSAWGKKVSEWFAGQKQKIDVKKMVILNIPYVIFFYLSEKVAWLYRHCIGDSIVEKLGVVFLNFNLAFQNPFPSFHIYDIAAGITCAVALKLFVYYKGKNAKKYRQGVEYGSARWGTAKDIEPFIDPVFEKNIILTQTERLTMNSRPKQPKYARNKNVIVIGGSGSGKTRFYVKPQLMQMTPNVSYVCTDPKGTIIVECGTMLKNGGYTIKALNTINFKKSMRYNPFHYIRSEKDILKLGGKESSTLKEISETLGKETIDLYNTSDTRGQSRSYGLNYQKTGKELMSRDELAVMDGSKCILQLRGVRPFFSDKFDITKHKRYKELADYDKKNSFDMEAYMKHELKMNASEEFDYYEIEIGDEKESA